MKIAIDIQKKMVNLKIGIALPCNFSLNKQYNYNSSSYYKQNTFMAMQYQSEVPSPFSFELFIREC